MGRQLISKPGRRNLAVAAQRAFDRFGDRESVFHDGAWHRSGRLHERSLRLAGGLAALGLRPGDRVVVFMLNSPTVGVCYLALWRAGAVIPPARAVPRAGGLLLHRGHHVERTAASRTSQ